MRAHEFIKEHTNRFRYWTKEEREDDNSKLWHYIKDVKTGNVYEPDWNPYQLMDEFDVNLYMSMVLDGHEPKRIDIGPLDKQKLIQIMRDTTKNKYNTLEGITGGVVGAVAGAALTKNFKGAQVGYQLGSAAQDLVSGDDAELDEKAGAALCRSKKKLGSSDHASCVSQGLRAHRSKGQGHTDGHGNYVKGKKAAGEKYGGPVKDYDGK
jgi:hypothetical protein